MKSPGRPGFFVGENPHNLKKTLNFHCKGFLRCGQYAFIPNFGKI